MTRSQCLGTISYTDLESLNLVESAVTEKAVERPSPRRPPRWPSAHATTDADVLGTAIHHALASGLAGATASDWAQICRRFATKFRVDTSDYELMTAYVSTIADALADATVLEREYEFSFVLAGWNVVGDIDLVVAPHDAAVLILDFKTGWQHASPTQLKLYLLACLRDTELAARIGDRALTGAQFWSVDLAAQDLCRYIMQLSPPTRADHLAAIESDIETRLQEAARPANRVSLWGPEFAGDAAPR